MTLEDKFRQVLMAAPSLGAIALEWLSAPLATWQVRLGVAFLLLQAAYLLRKWWREERAKRLPRRARRATDHITRHKP